MEGISSSARASHKPPSQSKEHKQSCTKVYGKLFIKHVGKDNLKKIHKTEHFRGLHKLKKSTRGVLSEYEDPFVAIKIELLDKQEEKLCEVFECIGSEDLKEWEAAEPLHGTDDYDYPSMFKNASTIERLGALKQLLEGKTISPLGGHTLLGTKKVKDKYMCDKTVDWIRKAD